MVKLTEEISKTMKQCPYHGGLPHKVDGCKTCEGDSEPPAMGQNDNYPLRCGHCGHSHDGYCQVRGPGSFAHATIKMTRERLTEIENRLGWGGSSKWPVAQHVILWAVAAETMLDKLEHIEKICRSTKHKDQIGDILKVVSANGSHPPNKPQHDASA